jgi:hypothetical protein
VDVVEFATDGSRSPSDRPTATSGGMRRIVRVVSATITFVR